MMTDLMPIQAADAAAPSPIKTPDGASIKTEGELKKVASQFEAVFTKMLISSMRKTVDKGTLFHAGRGEEVFSDLLDTHYAEAMSKKGKGLGIAHMIVKKYAAHVKAQEEQKGRVVDTGRAAGGAEGALTPGAVAEPAKADRHD